MESSWSSGREATSAVDPTYGQRSVFGNGTEATAVTDADIDVEDEEEALGYLRLVRAEAGKIPHVMIAPRHGPQAFPQTMVSAGAPKQQRRRRRRHWDEQEDGPSATKKRRVGQSAVELSYDDEDAADGAAGKDEIEDEDENDEHMDENRDTADNYYDRCLYENGTGDTRGYYEDGAYTAAPIVDVPQDGRAGGDIATTAEAARFSDVFRARLLAQFADLRAQLHREPPETAVTALPVDHDTAVGPLSTRSGAFGRWLRLLQTTDPLPAQLAAMDRISAFRLLRVMQRGLLVGGSASSRSSRSGRFSRWLAGDHNGKRPSKRDGAGLDMDVRTSRWLWAVLARLPDRGELGYAEMGYIRDVAKQAVMRLAHLSYDVEGGEVEEGEVEEGELEAEAEVETGVEAGVEAGAEARVEAESGTGKDVDDDLEDIAMDVESEPEEGQVEERVGDQAGRTEVHKQTGEEDGDMHQRATLEMVLAVAGEFYGQRDLLAFRSPWPSSRTV